jgi:hypothetical protein
LDIRLGGPENYAVDIATLAKETGQRAATPPPLLVKRESSESEGEDEGEKKGEGSGKKGKKHKVSLAYASPACVPC